MVLSYYIVSIYMTFKLFIILAPTFYLCKRDISIWDTTFCNFIFFKFNFWNTCYEVDRNHLQNSFDDFKKDNCFVFVFWFDFFFYTTVAILYFYTNICKTTLGVLIFIWKKCDGAKKKYKWFFFSFLDHFIHISMCVKTKNNNNGHFPTI